MAARILDNFRLMLVELKMAFSNKVPPSELQPTHYPMPEPKDYAAFYDLDPIARRKMTICNLFANYNKSIPEIIHLLEASPKLVIDALIDNRLVQDRRRTPRPRTPAPEELQH